MNKYIYYFLHFLLGSSLLCLLSAFQKILAGYPLALKGFYIPFFYGGLIGYLTGAFIFKLKKERERFRIVSDFAVDWEYWQDQMGNFIYSAPTCKLMTGYTPEEFIQNPHLLKQIIHPEDRESWEGHSHTKLETGEVEPIEFRIKTKKGDIIWIHHICRTVYDQHGKKCGVRGANRDITQQKKLQEELKTLKGFLPICASCKKIRDDKGYWNQIEAYIRDHSEVDFSHGICPECAKKLYPDINIYKDNEEQ